MVNALGCSHWGGGCVHIALQEREMERAVREGNDTVEARTLQAQILKSALCSTCIL